MIRHELTGAAPKLHPKDAACRPPGRRFRVCVGLTWVVMSELYKPECRQYLLDYDCELTWIVPLCCVVFSLHTDTLSLRRVGLNMHVGFCRDLPLKSRPLERHHFKSSLHRVGKWGPSFTRTGLGFSENATIMVTR